MFREISGMISVNYNMMERVAKVFNIPILTNAKDMKVWLDFSVQPNFYEYGLKAFELDYEPDQSIVLSGVHMCNQLYMIKNILIDKASCYLYEKAKIKNFFRKVTKEFSIDWM